MTRQLQSVELVIKELGGPEAVQALTNRKGRWTVPMWKHRKKFPPNTYTILKPALQAKNADAPDSLWGMP